MNRNEMRVIDNNLIMSDINSYVRSELINLALFLFTACLYGGIPIGVGCFFLLSDLNAYFEDIAYIPRIMGVALIVIVVVWLAYPFYCAVSKLAFVIKLIKAKRDLTFSLKEDRLDYIDESAPCREKPASERDLSEFFSRRNTRSRTETAYVFIENGRASNCALRGYKFTDRNDMFYLLTVEKTIISVYPQKIYRFDDI